MIHCRKQDGVDPQNVATVQNESAQASTYTINLTTVISA